MGKEVAIPIFMGYTEIPRYRKTLGQGPPGDPNTDFGSPNGFQYRQWTHQIQQTTISQFLDLNDWFWWPCMHNSL